jgi:uncharacterized protein (TIGR03437 family)
VRVSDPAALGSPQYLVAVLEVVTTSAATLLDFEEAGAVLVAPPGSNVPVTRRFVVGTSSQTPVAFQAAPSTLDGAGWLSVTPASGVVSSERNAEVILSASSLHLAPGIYRGEVVLSRAGVVRSFNLTFIVADAVAAAAARSKELAAAATCAPDRLAVTHTGMPNHFAVPAGWPQSMIVQVNDNCGRAVTNASVIAKFTNQDPPLRLTGDGTGTYAATWNPSGSGAQINVTVEASAAPLAAASAIIIGDVRQNEVPTLADNGTLHNLNPRTGGAMAPGLVVQIFGKGLATVSELTSAVPLPDEYKGTFVLIGRYQAPLFYVSPTQLVAQFPAELSPYDKYSVVVSANNALTNTDEVDVVTVQPGVAAFENGTLIAQHANFSLVTPENPARVGETLIMYLVGLGATNPVVPSGTQSPGATGLARPLVSPTVTIDGQAAEVVFAGLTPSGVGLFQINFQVPTGVRTGVPVDVIVRQGEEVSNVTKLTLAP